MHKYLSIRLSSYTKIVDWLYTCSIIFIIIFSRAIVIEEPGVAWKTLVAQRMLNGQNYLHDILEYNSPYNVLIYSVSIFLSEKIKITPLVINYFFYSIILLLCLILVEKIIIYRKCYLFEDANEIKLFRLSFFLAFTIFSCIGFSEGEHYISIFLLPITLIKFSERRFTEDPQEIKNLINIISILLGIIAFFLKPYYLISLFLIDLFSVIYFEKIFFDRLDLFIRLIGIVLFYCTLLIFFKGWLVSFKDSLTIYFYLKNSYIQMFIQWGNGCITQILLLIYFYKNNNLYYKKYEKLLVAIVFLSISNSVIFYLQGKGFGYHRLPYTLPLWAMALFIFIKIMAENKIHYKVSTFLVVSINYIFMIYTSSIVLKMNFDDTYTKIISQHNNDSFLCLSFREECSYFKGYIFNSNYLSRSLALYTLMGAKSLLISNHINKKTFDSYLNREIIFLEEDIKKKKPKLIIFEWWKNKNNTISDFSNHKLFHTVMKDYHLLNVDNIKDKDKAIWIYQK